MTESLRIGTPLKVALAATLAASLAISVWFVTSAVGQGPNRPEITDFNVFHLAGQLIWSGRYADAYRSAAMRSLETALGHGHGALIPWSYPPAFGFVVAPLAALPLGPAYLLFALGTLLLFCLCMRSLGGRHSWPVILATAPAILINIRAGQNGLLTGGLYGLAALWLLRGRPAAAGSAIGCLAVKPHLAPMLPIMLILQKRWSTLGAAALTSLALTGLSVAAFGPGVFSAFLASAGEVRKFMAVGAYPLHRMTSIYAFLLSIGAPSTLAILLHGVVALAILAWAAWTIRATEDVRIQIGMAATASAFISPYIYDYDGTIFAVGLMLLAPTLSGALSARRYGLLLFAIAVEQTLGIATGAFGIGVSLGGPVLLAAYLVILRSVYLDGERKHEARAEATMPGASHEIRVHRQLCGGSSP